MGLKILLACDENGVFSSDNDLPWNKIDEYNIKEYFPDLTDKMYEKVLGRLCRIKSADMNNFRELTKRKTVIMGYRTFQSIGHALPYRKNIIVMKHPLNISVGNLEFVDEIPDIDAYFIGGKKLLMKLLKDKPEIIESVQINRLHFGIPFKKIMKCETIDVDKIFDQLDIESKKIIDFE